MNRSWVRFPQAAQIRPPGSGWAFLYARVVLLVAPRLFRAPEVPAAREARRPHFVRRRASKPARALRTLRRPPHQWGWGADVWLCASPRSQAWPCHRPLASRPGPAFCSSPVPSGPSGAHGHRSLALRSLRCSPHGKRWGFCTTRSLLAACRRRVEPSCSAIPPIGAAAGRGYRVWVSCLEAFPIPSFACNSLIPAVCSSTKSPEFQRLQFKA